MGNAAGTGGYDMADSAIAGTSPSGSLELKLRLVVGLGSSGPRCWWWCCLLLHLLDSRLCFLNFLREYFASFQKVLADKAEVGNGDGQSNGTMPLDESEKVYCYPVHGGWCDGWSNDVDST